MEESTINVLRRSGTWKKYSFEDSSSPQNRSDKTQISESLNVDSLNENLEKIGKDIKRMVISENSRKRYQENSDLNSEMFNKAGQVDEKITKVSKKDLLPLLKELSELADKRSKHEMIIKDIDKDLGKIVSKIEKIKNLYQLEINKIKNHMELYDTSLLLIEKIKGDSSYDY